MRQLFSKQIRVDWRLAVAALALLGAACMKGPNYQRPVAAVPQSYKEAPPAGWKEAQPNDGVLRGKWWEIFGDKALNDLEEQVNISKDRKSTRLNSSHVCI